MEWDDDSSVNDSAGEILRHQQLFLETEMIALKYTWKFSIEKIYLSKISIDHKAALGYYSNKRFQKILWTQQTVYTCNS